MQNTKYTSKLNSYWLRHHPEDGDLSIDDFGWASVDELIKTLATKGQVFTYADIVEKMKDPKLIHKCC